MVNANNLLFALLFSLICLFVVLPSDDVAFAGECETSCAGQGGGANNGKVSGWQTLSGGGGPPTAAWNAFIDRFADKRGSLASTEKFISGLSVWSSNKDVTDMLTSCKNSEHIFWYGDNPYDWKNKAGMNAVGSPNNMNLSAADTWNKYVSQPQSDSGWGNNPGPILICSDGIGETVKVIKITLRADSGTYLYDSYPKTITSWKQISGELEPGDSITASAYGTRTEVGTSDVPITSYNITQTTDPKKVKYQVGVLKGKIVIEDSKDYDLYQCVTTDRDSVEAIVLNLMTITPFLDPSGMLMPMDKQRDPDSIPIFYENPKTGDTRADWVSWKSELIPVADDKKIEIDMSTISTGGDTVTNIFSKYGGILDVALTHKKEGYDVVFCQPQTRTVYWTYSEEYGFESHYTPWQNSGPEIIESISHKVVLPELGSYQILGMNCNNEEYLAAKGSSSVDYVKEQKDWKGRVVSGLFKTTLVEKKHTFPLGRGGAGSSVNDYTSGPTCKDNGLCTVAKTDYSQNDSHNNQLEMPLFTDYNKDGASQELMYQPANSPTNKGMVTMFRDFEERVARPDVWHLRETESGLVASESIGAVSTAFKIFDGFTPEYNITVIKPEGADDTAKFQAPNVLDERSGHINKVVFKSQWASLENKPYKLGVNWIYEIDGHRSTATLVTNEDVSMGVDITPRIQVGCQFFNTPEYEVNATINATPYSIPGLNRNLLQWNEEESVKVIFSRGISNRRD